MDQPHSIQDWRLDALTIVGGVVFAVLTLNHMSESNWFLAGMTGGTAGMFLIIPFVRRDFSNTVAAHMVIGGLFLNATGINCYTGGLSVPAFYVFGLITILAAILIDHRAGVVWAIISTMEILAIAGAHMAGVQFPDPTGLPVGLTESLRKQTLGSIALLWSTFFSYMLYHYHAERTQDSLREELSTAELRREQAEREAQLLEATQTARREFVASTMHDMRTPLHISLGYKDMLLDMSSSEEQRDVLMQMERSLTNLVNLSEDLLDFGKIEAGKVTVHPQRIIIRDVMEEVLTPFARQLQQRGIAYDLSVAEEVPAAMVCDPKRLGQVLTNLVGNAAKFTTTGAIRVATSVREHNLYVEVHDTGIGISATQQAHLFDPFFQGDDEHYDGAGLGLSICHKLITLMGGEIGVHSTPQQGSTFWFTLPLAKQDPSPLPPHDE